MAWLDTSLLVGVAAGCLLGGLCSDRFGRRPTVLVSAAIATVFGFYSAQASSVPELMLLRLVLGMALGAFGPASLSLTLESTPRALRGKAAMAVNGFSGVIGKVAVALLADSL